MFRSVVICLMATGLTCISILLVASFFVLVFVIVFCIRFFLVVVYLLYFYEIVFEAYRVAQDSP